MLFSTSSRPDRQIVLKLMSVIQVLLWALTLAALAMLTWKGKAVERISAGAILIVVIAPFAVQHMDVGNIRWVVALTSFALAGFFLFQGLTADRWWLLAAAGVQTAAAATYVLAFAQPDILIWTGVALRRLFWFELMLVVIAGAWEAQRSTLCKRNIP